jgi:hypothetical protein
MEVTYKKVVDGIKISTEQAIVIFNMCDMVYKTLSTQGTMSQEQLSAYDELKRVLTDVV